MIPTINNSVPDAKENAVAFEKKIIKEYITHLLPSNLLIIFSVDYSFVF